MVGIVSRADLLRVILTAPGRGAAADADRRIESEVMALARKEPWNVALNLSVTAHEGVVKLHGFCVSEAVRRALRVLAEQVEGVRGVEDRMDSLL